MAALVRENLDRYRERPVARDELEPMQIVARWLRERSPEEGRVIYLGGPDFDPAAII